MTTINGHEVFLKESFPHELEKPTDENITDISNKLNDICELLGDAPFDWYLVGGLGVDLCYGQMTRSHKDIEIEFDVKDAEKVISYIKKKGRSMVRHRFITKIFDKYFFWYAPINASDAQVDSRRPYFIMEKNNDFIVRRTSTLEPFIESYFKDEMEGEATVGWKSHTITLPFEYSPGLVYSANGYDIKLRNPAYSLALKLNSPHSKNKSDVEVLRNLVSQDEIRCIENLVGSLDISRKVK